MSTDVNIRTVLNFNVGAKVLVLGPHEKEREGVLHWVERRQLWRLSINPFQNIFFETNDVWRLCLCKENCPLIYLSQERADELL
jgi:hypothetical protein